MNGIIDFYSGIFDLDSIPVILNANEQTEDSRVESEIPFYGRNDEKELVNEYRDFRFVTEKLDNYQGPQIREIHYIAPEWNFFVLLFVIILFMFNKIIAPQKLKSLMTLYFQRGNLEKYVRENNPISSITCFFVFISFITLFSLFVQKLFVIYTGNEILYNGFGFYVDVFTFITLLYLINYLVTVFYWWLFKLSPISMYQITLHISTLALYNMILIPLLMIVFFYPHKLFCIIGMVIIIILFIIRVIKTLFEILFLSKLSFVNIFLYLCSVEVLPFSVIIRMGYQLMVRC